jgi:hypothetical protein
MPRKVLGAIGARVTEGEVAVGNAGERVDENGRLSEPNSSRRAGWFQVGGTSLASPLIAATTRSLAT